MDIYQSAFEHAPDALMVVDSSGAIVRANQRAERMFGYGRGELIGAAVESLLPDQLGAHHRGLREGFFAAPQLRPMGHGRPLAGRRKNGDPIAVQVMLSPLGAAADGLVLCALRDLSVRIHDGEVWAILESLVESATDAIIGIDLRGMIVSWNQAAERMFGYQFGEVRGQSFTILIPAIQADESQEMLRRLGQGETIDLIETTRLHKDGTPVSVWVRTAPIRTPAGTIIGATKIVRDMSAIKQAAAALRESEERFRGAFTHAAIGMALVGLDGRWLRVNPALCRIVGYGEDELLRSSFQAITHPDDQGIGVEQMLRLLDNQVDSYQFEKRYLHRDGHIVWALLSVSLVRDSQGGPRYFVSQIQDISARKATEEQLAVASRSIEEALALLDTLYAGAPTGLAFVDCDYRFVRCNEALAEMNGLPAGAHIGRAVAEVIPEIWPQVQPLYDSIMAGRGPIVNQEGAGVTAAAPGRRRHWLGSYYPVQLKDEIIGIGIIITEITEQKRLEEQLRQSQKMQAIGQLASGVAHDFNNLLTVINGYSDMLQIDLAALVGPGHPAGEALNAIRDAGERAALLTRQLLQLSRKSEPELVSLSVGDVVAGIARMVERLIGEHIALMTLVAENTRLVRADRSQIEQVVLNLALNARDAMPDGGRLLIEVRDSDLIDATPYRPGAYVLLAVSDTGVGMSPQVQERIFEPFFTTKEHGKGTGLGLATVYGIVTQSGGFITVYSEPSLGSTFNIYLPALAAGVVESPAEREPSYRLSGSETILLVEDEGGVRQIARVALETQGYRVIAAGDGAEALRLSARYAAPIDLLITDVVMPGMSGRQLAESLRADRSGLHVLFTSGYSGEAISRHGIVEESDGFLQKPFTPFSLARRVREVLDRHQAPGGRQ